MRTTLTLGDDVAQQVHRRMRERRTTFKETVNDLIRRGLVSSEGPEPYTTPTFAMGVRPDLDLDKALALALAGAMEDEEARRKLERAK